MRVYNFSAGPSMLPLPVLEKVQANLIDYNGTGMSVMEMSHRSKPYQEINDKAESLLRELLGVPENYDIIFVQGGGSTQFEAVPLNLTVNGKADYIVTGNFAQKAYKEAKKYTDARCVASSEDKNFTYIPKVERKDFRDDADYVHICFNNTIFGSHFNYVPDTGDIPLVADMSSCIRRYLCRRTEKRRTCRCNDRDRSQRSAGQSYGYLPYHAQVEDTDGEKEPL